MTATLAIHELTVLIDYSEIVCQVNLLADLRISRKFDFQI